MWVKLKISTWPMPLKCRGKSVLYLYSKIPGDGSCKYPVQGVMKDALWLLRIFNSCNRPNRRSGRNISTMEALFLFKIRQQLVQWVLEGSPRAFGAKRFRCWALQLGRASLAFAPVLLCCALLVLWRATYVSPEAILLVELAPVTILKVDVIWIDCSSRFSKYCNC